MSLINELDDVTRKMPPRFMRLVKDALNQAQNERSEETLGGLQSAISNFIEAARIVGLDELEDTLHDLNRVILGPDDTGDTLNEFIRAFEKLEEAIPPESEEPAQREPVDIYETEEPVDRTIIDRFMMIPGIGEGKAYALLRGGFENIEELADASISRIFKVNGISLQLAKEIADFLNPERLIDIELLPQADIPVSPTTEIPFTGKVDRIAVVEMFDDLDSEGDPELLNLYMGRLKGYVDTISSMLETLPHDTSPTVALADLEDDSYSLINASRYMGFDRIEKEIFRVSEAAQNVVLGETEFSGDTTAIIENTHKRLKNGLEELERTLNRLLHKKEYQDDTAREGHT